jgi:hypothetical protein
MPAARRTALLVLSVAAACTAFAPHAPLGARRALRSHAAVKAPRAAARSGGGRSGATAAAATTMSLDIGTAVSGVKWVLAAPTLYALMSVNEYVTHRYFQARAGLGARKEIN